VVFLTAAQKTILPFRGFSNCDPAVTTINSKITPLGANQTVGFQVDGKHIIISMHRMKSMAAMCHYCRENSYLLYYTPTIWKFSAISLVENCSGILSALVEISQVVASLVEQTIARFVPTVWHDSNSWCYTIDLFRLSILFSQNADHVTITRRVFLWKLDIFTLARSLLNELHKIQPCGIATWSVLGNQNRQAKKVYCPKLAACEVMKYHSQYLCRIPSRIIFCPTNKLHWIERVIQRYSRPPFTISNTTSSPEAFLKYLYIITFFKDSGTQIL